MFLAVNPDKPVRIATKALRHKQEMLIITKRCVFASWRELSYPKSVISWKTENTPD